MSCRGSACGVRRIRVAQGDGGIKMCRGMLGDVGSTHRREHSSHRPVPATRIRLRPQSGQDCLPSRSRCRRTQRQHIARPMMSTGAPHPPQSRCRFPTTATAFGPVDYIGGIDRPRVFAVFFVWVGTGRDGVTGCSTGVVSTSNRSFRGAFQRGAQRDQRRELDLAGLLGQQRRYRRRRYLHPRYLGQQAACCCRSPALIDTQQTMDAYFRDLLNRGDYSRHYSDDVVVEVRRDRPAVSGGAIGASGTQLRQSRES